MGWRGSPHEEYESNIFFMRILQILIEIKHVKCYKPCLTHDENLVNGRYLYYQCSCYCDYNWKRQTYVEDDVCRMHNMRR